MNIQKLKKVIQEANPEIMELKFGCEFENKIIGKSLKVKNNKYLIFGNHQGFIEAVCEDDRGVRIATFDESAILEAKATKILGRSIRLANVLLALDKYSQTKELPDVGKYPAMYIVGQVVSLWDCKDNNFDNQSDELYELLTRLLVKDNE